VKEPLECEYDLFHEDQILYTYLHLAADLKQTKALLAKKVKAVAYETVMEKDGSLPLLIPMSQIAGRLSVQEGAKYLEKSYGGRGILLGGVPGIKKGNVLIIGGGISGANACKIAIGMGADVTIMDISAKRLSDLDDIFGNSIKTLYSNSYNIDEMVRVADLVIGAVLIPGAVAPKVIKRDDLKKMKKGSVIVDIAVDQGGCTETTRPTDHSNPTYIIDGVVHYCVANMPGAVSLSSTYALTSVTNRYGLMIANMGLEKAAEVSDAVLKGINCYKGKLTNKPVAEAHGMKYERL
jgi:alanine dehydrogenase